MAEIKKNRPRPQHNIRSWGCLGGDPDGGQTTAAAANGKGKPAVSYAAAAAGGSQSTIASACMEYGAAAIFHAAAKEIVQDLDLGFADPGGRCCGLWWRVCRHYVLGSISG